MSDLLNDQSIKTLDTVNDFPHVGLIYFENSGENLLRFYIEQIFRIQTQTNIRKEFLTSSERLSIYSSTSNSISKSFSIIT